MNATDRPKPPYQMFAFIRYPFRWIACWILWTVGDVLINTGNKKKEIGK